VRSGVAVVPQAKIEIQSGVYWRVTSPSRNSPCPISHREGRPDCRNSRSRHGTPFRAKGHAETIIDKLNAALVTAFDDEAIRKVVLDLGGGIPDPTERSPEALAALVRSEITQVDPAPHDDGEQN